MTALRQQKPCDGRTKSGRTCDGRTDALGSHVTLFHAHVTVKTGNCWVKSKLFLQLLAGSVKTTSWRLCSCDLMLLTANFYWRAPHQRTSGQAGQHHGCRHFVHVHLLLGFPVRARNIT